MLWGFYYFFFFSFGLFLFWAYFGFGLFSFWAYFRFGLFSFWAFLVLGIFSFWAFLVLGIFCLGSIWTLTVRSIETLSYGKRKRFFQKCRLHRQWHWKAQHNYLSIYSFARSPYNKSKSFHLNVMYIFAIEEYHPNPRTE